MNGAQRALVEEVIRESFDMYSFPMVLKYRLNKTFGNYLPIGAPYEFAIFTLVGRAIQEEWVEELIYALLSERPKNSKLLSLAMELKISFDAYADKPGNNIAGREALENLVNGDPEMNPEQLIQGISRTKRCVCRIEYADEQGRRKWGTGFLVGKDLVLSNYHVFEDIIKNKQLASGVVCKFDYEVRGDGKSINQGTDIEIDQSDPVLAYSSYCDYDVSGTNSINVDWPAESLDYALVRLKTPVGDLPFGSNFTNAATAGIPVEKRGWISASDEEIPLFDGSHMIIIQHPDKLPVKIAFGFSKVRGTDDNKRRVRYEINTLPGSSGSPCFDHKFNWAAMHNMGDPSWNPSYNQGIPAKQIVNDLKRKGISI